MSILIAMFRTRLCWLTCAVLLSSCTRPLPDADVIVIGSGIAGLSAALEAGAAGQSVLVLDANSVGGGHAVKAGGFALVGTPLQEKKGFKDNPQIAARDLLAWGEEKDGELSGHIDAAFAADRRIANSEGAAVSAQQSHFYMGNSRGFRGGLALKN